MAFASRVAKGQPTRIAQQPSIDGRAEIQSPTAGNNCTPSLDAQAVTLSSVIRKIQVTVPGTITNAGNAGTITLHTMFESQMNDLISSSTNAAGQPVGSAVGGAVSGAGTGILSGVGEVLGLSTSTMCAAAAVCVVCLSVSAATALKAR